MTTALELRDDLIQFVRNDLVGPAHGENELLDDPPKICYGAGVLFPRECIRNEAAAVGGIEGDGDIEAGADESTRESVVDSTDDKEGLGEKLPPAEYDDAVTLANTYQPSAIGLSFMVGSDYGELSVDCRAAVYDRIK